MKKNILYRQDILSTENMTLDEVQLILDMANRAEKALPLLQNKIIANCFFEPSTRTKLSFETAALRLGAQTIGFSNADGLSIQKGETLQDTMRVIADYADLIVIRHPEEGSAQIAADIADCPVINAGDGANQHPTQALLDIFTIQRCQGKLDGLSMAIVGDLKYSRTIHSLLELLAWFEVRLYFVAPDFLMLPNEKSDVLKKRGVLFSFHQTLEEIMPKVDILYMTRVQKERFNESVKTPFILNAALLKNVKPNLKVLHPLPRINEISPDVDATPYAYYFQQASNGVVVRQALLNLLLSDAG